MKKHLPAQRTSSVKNILPFTPPLTPLPHVYSRFFRSVSVQRLHGIVLPNQIGQFFLLYSLPSLPSSGNRFRICDTTACVMKNLNLKWSPSKQAFHAPTLPRSSRFTEPTLHQSITPSFHDSIIPVLQVAHAFSNLLKPSKSNFFPFTPQIIPAPPTMKQKSATPKHPHELFCVPDREAQLKPFSEAHTSKPGRFRARILPRALRLMGRGRLPRLRPYFLEQQHQRQTYKTEQPEQSEIFYECPKLGLINQHRINRPMRLQACSDWITNLRHRSRDAGKSLQIYRIVRGQMPDQQCLMHLRSPHQQRAHHRDSKTAAQISHQIEYARRIA
jgi:hypothetical protein